MNFVLLIIGFGILQAAVLVGLLLLTPNRPKPANLFMAGLMLVISARLVHGWLTFSEPLIDILPMRFSISALAFTWGPLLYGYAYTLTRQKLSWLQLLHFLPFLFVFVASLRFYFLDATQSTLLSNYLWHERDSTLAESHIEPILSTAEFYFLKYRLNAIGFVLHFSTYCFLVLQRIKKHNQLLQLHFSSTDKMNLRWLQSLTQAGLMYLAVLVFFNRGPQLLLGGNGLSAETPYLFLVVWIYVIVIAAIYQPAIIRGASRATAQEGEATEQPEKIIEQGPLDSNPPANNFDKKYERSQLPFEQAQQFKTELMNVVFEQQLYLDSELTLPVLAEQAKMTSHHVSQVLNGQLRQNFFTFINGYRIEYAKTLMSSEKHDHFGIIDIAMECGFKSKSSFYRAFKEATDMTPAAYRSKHRSKED